MSRMIQPEIIGRYLLFLYAILCGTSRAGSHVVIAMLFIVFIWYCLKYKKHVTDCLPKGIFKWFLFMALCIAASIVFSADKLGSSKFLALFLYNQLVFFYAFCFIKKKEDVVKLFLVIILSVGINGLANIWQAANGVIKTKGFLTIMTTSALFGMTVPMIVILLLNVKKIFGEKNALRYAIFFLSIILLCLAGMFCNETRISFVGIFCALGVYFIFKLKPLSWQKKIAVIVCIAVLTALFFNLKENVLFDTSLKRKNWSNALRILMWEYGWDTFKNNSIFGVGAGVLPDMKFAEKEGIIFLEGTTSEKYGHVHNASLQLLATTGIAGFVGYLLFWYNAVLKNIIISLFNKQNNSVYIDILITTTVFFVVNNMTDVIYTGLPMYFFSILASLCLVGTKDE